MAKYAEVWDLDSLYPNPQTPEFAQALESYRAGLTELAESSESLPPVSADTKSAKRWGAFIERFAALGAQSSDLHAFIGCHAAADAQNKSYQRYEAVLASLAPLREQAATNVELALREVSDDDLAAFVEGDDRLKQIRFFFSDARANSALRLPKEQELLASELAVDGLHAWGRLYDRLSGELRIDVMEKGEIVGKSPGQVQFDSPQRSVRQNNFYAASKAWDTIADTCTDALNHISGTRLTKYRRLGLTDHLDAPLRFNRLERETLETMWSVVTERKPVLKKYLSKKAELLGLERLCWYDIQAPLPGAADTSTLTYDAACDLVVKTFNEFSRELGDFAQQAIDDRWIEVENRSGKRQGGFCTDVPLKKQSRIFMTYTGTSDSMSTLAHELGHAYHTFVLRDQPVLLQDYPMNLAETASTFAEAVLGDRRLNDATSDGAQMAILDGMLSDSVAFLMNIHARFIFEDRFHKERQQGELSAERLSELMLAAQRETYCEALDDEGYYPGFWISKLHFYISGWPFYNFPYTFGYLLSLGVYSLADEFGDDFPQKIRDLLIATGCMTTEQAVQESLGYDLRQPDFWHKSMDIVDERVERFVGA